MRLDEGGEKVEVTAIIVGWRSRSFYI
jgi:hypothetical protein